MPCGRHVASLLLCEQPIWPRYSVHFPMKMCLITNTQGIGWPRDKILGHKIRGSLPDLLSSPWYYFTDRKKVKRFCWCSNIYIYIILLFLIQRNWRFELSRRSFAVWNNKVLLGSRSNRENIIFVPDPMKLKVIIIVALTMLLRI